MERGHGDRRRNGYGEDNETGGQGDEGGMRTGGQEGRR